MDLQATTLNAVGCAELFFDTITIIDPHGSFGCVAGSMKGEFLGVHLLELLLLLR